ncbi:MAG: phosphoribosylglycinamide formyltransferase [Eubacteriales bacterium]|nr:phosphoribosylglycinamide formyltransferase [Eubacteriales bacterium]
MFKIGVLVSGGGTNLQAIIDNIKNGKINAKIETVFSNKEDAYALKRAKDNNIETKVLKIKDFESKELFEKALIDYLQEKQLDLIVLAGFMVILSEKFTKTFENKIINIHPSLIPAFSGAGYYGLKVHEGALERGVKIAGATVHFVTEEADAGPIIIQKAVYVEDDDTPETLQKRVMEQAEWEILPEAINLIINKKIEIIGNKVRRK